GFWLLDLRLKKVVGYGSLAVGLGKGIWLLDLRLKRVVGYGSLAVGLGKGIWLLDQLNTEDL
ncbi:MAG TPA: hypothetical protein VFG10_02690, partial [Saprospiraceae bacterium]|nr:hypothetical protein [Saprospiraceae bacterium]